MYNLATNAPPEAVEVNGGAYLINTDFRVWIEIMDKFMFESDDSNALMDCVCMAFLEPERVLSENDPKSVFEAMCGFLRGYPEDGSGESNENGENDCESDMSLDRDFDFKVDLNWIILAIRNQSGIDLSYRCKHFHWWEFLLEFKSLEDHHYFSLLRRIRSYEGDDKEMIKQRERFALPVRYTAAQRKELDEFNAMFK